MKELYEKLAIDIDYFDNEDPITASSSLDDDHDNGFIGWDEFE